MKRKKLIFLILAIVLVFSIVGFRVIQSIDAQKATNNKLFLDSLDIVDKETEDVYDEEINSVEIIEDVKEEQVKQEEQYTGTDNIVNKSSNSTSNNFSNKINTSPSSSSSQSNNSSSNNQNNSQASESSSSNIVEDNSVDTTHPSYYIHKGKSDCIESSACMDISLPIQFEYKKVIANTYYIEVYAKNGSILGYFIEYVFKEYTYSSYDECNNVGSEIKTTLSDRVIGYTCSPDGTLKINTNY